MPPKDERIGVEITDEQLWNESLERAKRGERIGFDGYYDRRVAFIFSNPSGIIFNSPAKPIGGGHGPCPDSLA